MGKSTKSKRSRSKSVGAARAKRPKGRVLLSVLKWTFTIGIWSAVVGGGIIAFYAYDLPPIDQALVKNTRPAVTLIAADGSRLASIGDFKGASVRLSDLPPYLPKALIAIEDRRFYEHGGIDWQGIGRAMLVNLKAGRIRQGGSTLTQQAAKNLFLSPERTLKRKIQETLLALWMERRFTKDQILTIYLNRVYFGAGAFGIEAAARRFFDRAPAQLSLHQSAVIVGTLKAPSRLNPVNDTKAANTRAATVLAAMQRDGYITKTQLRKAKLRPLSAAHIPPRTRSGRYFVDWVVDQLPGFVGPDAGDITVVTTLDPRLQAFSERQVRSVLGENIQHKRVSQVAATVLSPDGAVRAMIGGRDYSKSQFNRAVQARRQPGSAFKPLVYLAGLEAGLTPETILIDAPVAFDGWRPKNYDGKYIGQLTVRDALVKSVNTVAVKVAAQAGINRVVSTAERLGITSELRPALGLALGASEVGVLEMTSAYATLANGGIAVWPYGIQEIRNAAGETIYRRSGDGPPRVAKRKDVSHLTEMLSDVISNGTGRAAAIDRPAAGKTGTSQQFRDAWFVGYTADFVAGVWFGNDNGAPMKGVTGGGMPARLWRDIMLTAHRDMPPRPLHAGAVNDESEKSSGGFWRRLMDKLGGS